MQHGAKEESTIEALVARQPGTAVAFLAADRPPLSYAGLLALMQRTRARLNRLGIGRHDRVAIVLPNGPEMAAAFVCLAAGAATAPLNPAYKADELDFYLGDLGAKAVVVLAGEDSDDLPAVPVARRHGARVLRLQVPGGDSPAGSFTLASDEDAAGAAAPAHPGAAAPNDVVLVLHTSGTTSRPKMVPLLQRNLVASAEHIRTTLRLGPEDRCLNVMPLFHIHGLVAAVLASLAAGGSVHLAPGFNALRFFAWLDQAAATWYTAVPTMHQAILARAGRNAAGIERARLRLIRSSSASLPPQVMRELEATFRCPVIESYGMTEAAHQMTSNPLPPAARKPGSVGLPAGPLVRIADEAGSFLPEGTVGEVVISGPNVTPGYAANPEADAKAFFIADGRRWFRTGDQGLFDTDGYFRLTSRLKEIINRGGEKIAPIEVDEALMDHPAVRQAVAFAIPHPTLGEEVAAAVVLREEQTADEPVLRAFAAARLASHKVPRRILILDEIPKGATGKLQRIGLAQKLGLG